MKKYWIDAKKGVVQDWDKDGGYDLKSFMETEETNGSKVNIDFKLGTVKVFQ